MECNKEEARRAIDLAEKKISENDYNVAKKLISKAQRLYPELDGLKQVLMMIDVYISATNKTNGEADWYGILGVDPLADDEAMKKQYKNLALLLHPDKNRFNGAEGAFKLVSQAWDLLSNKARRTAYDLNRMHNQPKPYESKPKPEPDSSWKHEKIVTFFTMCNRCNAYCEYVKKFYLNKTVSCPNCGQDFVANFVADEITPEMSYGKPVFRLSISFQSIRKSDSDSTKAHSAAKAGRTKADCAKTANQSQEMMKRWFEKSRERLAATVAAAAAARGTANSTTREAERPSKKPTTNSTFEEERLFKKPMTTGNVNSTHEAERLFKKPMTTGNVNSTQEAQRIFKKPMTDVK